MTLTKFDILTKAPDYDARTATLALARWKWDVLERADGTRTLADAAGGSNVDDDIARAFLEECVADGLLEPQIMTREAYRGRGGSAASTSAAPTLTAVPSPAPLPAPTPAPPPLPAMPSLEPSAALSLAPQRRADDRAASGDAAGSKAASLQERVAALKARALTAMQEASDRPRPEAVASTPPPAPVAATAPAPVAPAPRSAIPDEVEFALEAGTPKAPPPTSLDAVEFSL